MEGAEEREGLGGVVYIYCLRDPDTQSIRYVGMAANPVFRFGTHLAQAKYCTTRKDLWLRSLKARLPILEVLEEVPTPLGAETEKAWIVRLRGDGCDLLNDTFKSPVVVDVPGGDDMTANQAAVHKGVSRQAVSQAIQEGRLAARKQGCFYMVRRNDVEAWQPVRRRSAKMQPAQ